MPRPRKSEQTLSQMKMERLRAHLVEVERIVRKWISELNAPSPFQWSESTEAVEFEADRADMPVRIGLSGVSDGAGQPSGWSVESPYVPATEQDPAENHMLRKHLRKRSIWLDHTQWERRLERVAQLARTARGEVLRLIGENKGAWKATEGYGGTALEAALNLAVGLKREDRYWQKPAFRHGVWYGEILIEKSAQAKDLELVASQHRKLTEDAASSKEMQSLAEEWQEVLRVEARMRGLATRALKASDILYPCQFCRKLW